MALTNGIHMDGDTKEAKEDLQTSPYTTPPVDVKVGANGTVYRVFEALIDRYPGLQARMKQRKSGRPIELPEVDDDIGHAFIHFIFTGEYHSAGLGGASEVALTTAEFKRSVLLYCAARLCVMDVLEQLTKERMDDFGKRISIFELHDVVVNVTPRLSPNEIWFHEHLYRWVKDMLQEDDHIVTDEKLLNLVGRSSLFDKAVVRSVAEMYKEKSAALGLFTTQAHTDVPTEVDVELDPGSVDLPDRTANEEIESKDTPVPSMEATYVEGLGSSDMAVLPTFVLKDAQASEVDSTKADSVMAPENEDQIIQTSATAEDALEDSDVQAARAAAGKKKKKGKKKGNGQAQTAAQN